MSYVTELINTRSSYQNPLVSPLHTDDSFVRLDLLKLEASTVALVHSSV